MAKEAVNSDMADLNQGVRFAKKEDKENPAIDQIEAFIEKVKAEITKGEIPETVGQNLINKANHLKYMVKN
jgi:hypothetical protein